MDRPARPIAVVAPAMQVLLPLGGRSIIAEPDAVGNAPGLVAADSGPVRAEPGPNPLDDRRPRRPILVPAALAPGPREHLLLIRRHGRQPGQSRTVGPSLVGTSAVAHERDARHGQARAETAVVGRLGAAVVVVVLRGPPLVVVRLPPRPPLSGVCRDVGASRRAE